MKVLIGIDQADTYKRVASFFKRNNWFRDAEIRLVLATTPPMVDAGMYPGAIQDLMQSLQDNATEVLRKAVAELQPMVTKEIKSLSMFGAPSYVLVDEIKAWHPDIVLLAAQHHAIWEKVLCGSVSSFVADRAPCSVLILKEEGKPEANEPQQDMIFCAQCERTFIANGNGVHCPACSNNDRATLPIIYHHDDPLRAEMFTSADWQAGD